MNRKRLLLAVLIGALVLSLAYAFWAMPRQEQAPPRAEQPRATKKPAVGKKLPPTADRLNLGLLNQEVQPFPGADRDIFRFRGGSNAVPVPAPVVIAVPVQVEPSPPPPPPPPPPTPEELLRGAVAQITFLGFLDKGGQRTVFLSGGGELFLVKAGEAFGKNKLLLAKEITEKYLVVGWAQGPETVRVELAENEALKPAVLTPGPAAASPAQKFQPNGGPRSGGASFPPRRILPQRANAQPVTPAEPQEEDVQTEVPQGKDVQEELQPPGEGVKLEELLKKRLQGGEGNGT